MSSIARVRFGDLSVGPQSAGANPGPACYARGGTDATATDADLVLGVLNPDYFIGGRMRLDMVRARAAINASVAQPLGLDTLAAAWGMREVLDNKMADLLRRVTVERGHDPRDFLLLAAGGAGPSHAWSLARELGLSGFVVPPAATAQSAFGTANTDLGLAIDRPVYLRVNSGVEPSPDECARIAAAAAEASSAARAGLADAGSTDVHLHRTLAIRYRGQANALDVSVDNDLAVGGSAVDQANLNATELNATILRFERDYERLFGRGAGYRRAGFEVIGLRVIARGSVSPPQIQSGRDSFTSHGSRAVVFDDPKAPTMTHIYRAAFPAPDQFLDGPCIVEYPGQSAVVPPGARASTDRLGNLHVRFASAA